MRAYDPLMGVQVGVISLCKMWSQHIFPILVHKHCCEVVTTSRLKQTIPRIKIDRVNFYTVPIKIRHNFQRLIAFKNNLVIIHEFVGNQTRFLLFLRIIFPNSCKIFQ